MLTSDGRVPVFHRAFDGNLADVGMVVAVMLEVRQHVSLPDCLVIGDTKLLSAGVLRQLREQNVRLLAPLPRSEELDQELLGPDPDGRARLDYLPQEQANRPEDQRAYYVGQEVPWGWAHPGTGKSRSSAACT